MSAPRIAHISLHIAVRVLGQQDKPDDFVRWRAVEEMNAWGVVVARDEAMPPGWRYVVQSPQDIEIKWRRPDFPDAYFRNYGAWVAFLERERVFTDHARIEVRAKVVAIESEQARFRREAWDSLRHELSEGRLSLPTNPELIRRVSEEPVLDGGNDIWSRVASAMRVPSRQLNPDPICPNDPRFSRPVDTARGHERAYFGDARYHDIAYSSSLCARPSVRSQLFDRALFFERAQPAPWSIGVLCRWTVQPYLQRSMVDGGRRWKIVRWRSRRRPWETWCEVGRPPLNHAATTDRMPGRALFGVEHPAEIGKFAGLCDKYKNRPENLVRNRRLLLQLGADKFATIPNAHPEVLL